MIFLQKTRTFLTALILVVIIAIAPACATVSQAKTPDFSTTNSRQLYTQLERGNSTAGQKFGDWVVQTSQGLINDAYVRDNNKLGVVISQQVKPNEVRQLARSLAQGFHHNFPDRDATVLVYAPDKKLILTAKYDRQSNQVQYQ